MHVMGTLQSFFRPNTNAQLNAGSDGVPAVSGPLSSLLDELALRALRAVFGMDSKGRIKKEKAWCVVKELGLVEEGEDVFGFREGEEEEELNAEELLGSDDGDETNQDRRKQAELMRQAFMVFDRDGDGFIEASEVKRVLECLGLAKGREIEEFEKMVQVVDLNSDGKVDFSEFELMMGGK